MAKFHKVEKKIYEGCAVESLCDGPCRYEHRKIYNPATKDVQVCPAYYRFTYEKPRARRGQKIKANKLVMKELR